MLKSLKFKNSANLPISGFWKGNRGFRGCRLPPRRELRTHRSSSAARLEWGKKAAFGEFRGGGGRSFGRTGGVQGGATHPARPWRALGADDTVSAHWPPRRPRPRWPRPLPAPPPGRGRGFAIDSQWGFVSLRSVSLNLLKFECFISFGFHWISLNFYVLFMEFNE